MQNFAQQCSDLAQVLLESAVANLTDDGTVVTPEGEHALPNESAHALAALAEFYCTTHEATLCNRSVVEMAQHCLAHQLQQPTDDLSFLQCALAVLAFHPAKERNPLWTFLEEHVQQEFAKQLLVRNHDTDAFSKTCSIVQSIARYSLGFSKKEDTPRLIDEFLQSLSSLHGWVSGPNEKCADTPDLATLQCFLFIRQALTLHTHFAVCERKLPSLRTGAEKIFKLLPDLTRSDGLAWSYGPKAGIYGQLYAMTLVVQFFHDQWVPNDKIPLYSDLLCRLFQYFFTTYVDVENGCLLLRDTERSIPSSQTTRSITFDTIRFLCQCARFTKKSTVPLTHFNVPAKTKGRWVCFEQNYRQEQGVFLYQDAASGLLFQLPLVHQTEGSGSNLLAFPHSTGVFDEPLEAYVPAFLPELTIQGTQVIPSFYGLHGTSGLRAKNSLYFSYEQPELISKEGTLLKDLGSCKITWNFSGSTVLATFVYQFKQPVTIERLRYVIPLSMPHSSHHLPSSFMLGEKSLQASVVRDDFNASWQEIVNVCDQPHYRTTFGKICYLQTLERSTPLHALPGKEYHLQIELKPDVKRIGG